MSTLPRKKKPANITHKFNSLRLTSEPVVTMVWDSSEGNIIHRGESISGAFASKVYEWDGIYGDVAPAIPEMEIELFGHPEQRLPPQGENFDWDQEVEVVQSKNDNLKIQPIESFETAGLHPVMRENIKLMGYTKPTPIQKCVIPAIYHNRDILALTQTGSGKTAAFLIPIINQLLGKVSILAAKRPAPHDPKPVMAEPLAAIIAPTRELAIQIFDEARKFCYRTNLRPAVVYGGVDIDVQARYLGRGCELLIGTPGRVASFLRAAGVLTLSRLRYLVIDEADELIAEDFCQDIDLILKSSHSPCSGETKRLLFSATFPGRVEKLAMGILPFDHIRFYVGRSGSTVGNIQQSIHFVDVNQKHIALMGLMRAMPAVRTIIFTNTSSRTEAVAKVLRSVGVPCVSIHAQRPQAERELAFRAFRKGEAPVLVTTSLTGRGVDVKNVGHVINYDLPRNQESDIREYVHRIGRTGRIGHDGVASSLFCAGDQKIGPDLALLLLEANQHVPDFLQKYLPGKVVKVDTFPSQAASQSVTQYAKETVKGELHQVSQEEVQQVIKENVKYDTPLINFDD